MGFFSNRFVILFLVLPHLGIYLFEVGQFGFIIKFLQLGVILPFIFLKIFYKNTFNYILLLLTFLILLSGLINGNITLGTLFNVVTLIGLCSYLLYTMNNFKELIASLYYLLSIIVVVNFLTMLISAFQVDGFYLLGGKNYIQLTIIPAITIFFIYSYFNYKKLKKVPFLLILISIISLVLSGSGTALVIGSIIFIFVFLPKRFTPTLNTYILIYIITFFSIVIFKFQLFFSNLIINILHKDLTLSGRTYIWDFVLEKIKDSWIFGYGIESTIIKDNFLNVSQSHNGVLQVLMASGIVGLVLFIVLLIVIGKKLSKHRNSPISKVLSASIFIFMFLGLTESVFYRIEFWIILVISYNIDKIINQFNFKFNIEKL